jgi:transposase
MAGRSKVELFEQIRRARRDDPSVSIRELARRFSTHRRTVHQALASAVPPPRKVQERSSPVMDQWKPIVDGWLTADLTAPRKQRHTARRIWQRLVDEHQAVVAESTVREYVRGARPRLGFAAVEVTVPQIHPLGVEAEVDFGAITFRLAGVEVVGELFTMRLSASGKAFRRAYLNEAQEVFLDGHVRAFEHFGGVPTRIRYDNLKTAVVRVLRGRDRVESERFVLLRSHYGFDSFFCQPGVEGAHEKGGVEGEIGRFRRRAFVPIPDVASMAELNELLDRIGAADDEQRHIGGRFLTVAEHGTLDSQALQTLPAEAFDPARELSCRVDSKSRVCVRQSFYSVPIRYAGRRLLVRLGAEHLEVFDGRRVVASHPRSAHKHAEILVLDHYLEIFSRKPGALLNATPLARARASGAFSETHDRFWTVARARLGDRAGTNALIEVLLAQRQVPATAVIAGMTAALSIGSVDPAVVMIEARKTLEPDAVVIPIGEHLTRFDRPAPSLARYDDLLEAQ